MSEYILSIEGTETAARLALLLALLSAVCHAIFGALQKSKDDPLLIRAAIDFWFMILILPFALFVVPWPNAYEWLLIAGIIPIHTLYKTVLVGAYRNGEFTVIYPIARGSAPFFTALAAGFVFREYLTPLQWFGVILISAMIMSLAVEAIRRAHVEPHQLFRAVSFALATGFMIMVYAIYDAYGVRASRTPFIFLAWFFVVEGFAFPIWAYLRRRVLVPVNGYKPLIARGLLIAPFGIVSFGAVFVASRIGHVGEVMALRETSVIFAALIGMFFLGERVSWQRLFMIALIALGAVLIEVGGF